MTGAGVFVLALTRLTEGGKVADATVRIGAVTVHHVLLLRMGRHGAEWELGVPRRWEGTGYADLVTMDKPLRAQVLAAVLAAYQEQAA
jgi:hypothetical protein